MIIQDEIGKSAFQELDQCMAATPYVKFSDRANKISEIPRVIQSAFQSCLSGGLGPAYVDIPSNIFMQHVMPEDKVDDLLKALRDNVDEGSKLAKSTVNSLLKHVKSSER